MEAGRKYGFLTDRLLLVKRKMLPKRRMMKVPRRTISILENTESSKEALFRNCHQEGTGVSGIFEDAINQHWSTSDHRTKISGMSDLTRDEIGKFLRKVQKKALTL